MKKTYTQPAIDIENVVVENGIAVSYGEPGYPGQDSGFNDGYDEDL